MLLQVPENVEVALERGNGQRGWRSLEKAEKASQFLVEAWKNRVEMNRTSLETAGGCDCHASVRAMRRCQMDMRTFLETEERFVHVTPQQRIGWHIVRVLKVGRILNLKVMKIWQMKFQGKAIEGPTWLLTACSVM